MHAWCGARLVSRAGPQCGAACTPSHVCCVAVLQHGAAGFTHPLFGLGLGLGLGGGANSTAKRHARVGLAPHLPVVTAAITIRVLEHAQAVCVKPLEVLAHGLRCNHGHGTTIMVTIMVTIMKHDHDVMVVTMVVAHV